MESVKWKSADIKRKKNVFINSKKRTSSSSNIVVVISL